MDRFPCSHHDISMIGWNVVVFFRQQIALKRPVNLGTLGFVAQYPSLLYSFVDPGIDFPQTENLGSMGRTLGA